MKLSIAVAIGFAAGSFCAFPLAAQQPAAPAGMQVIVTALASHGQAPAIAASQVDVKQGHDQDPVTAWARPAGADSRVDLVIVIDDDTQNLRDRLDDIKSFIGSLPDNVAVGIVYMHTGTIQIAQAFTLDHSAAAKTLREPGGVDGSSPSPFTSLQVLMSKWPRHPGRRREMIFLSDGSEHLGGNNSNNQTFLKAVADTVASNVVAYTILVTGAGPLTANQVTSTGGGVNSAGQATDSAFPASAGAPFGGKGFARMNTVTNNNSGSVNLGMLAEATGGEAFSQGNGTPTRFTPFLDEIARCLKSQYLLTFTPAAGRGVIDIKIEVHHSPAKILAPKEIVLAAPAS